MSSANLDLVRSIYAAWARGDFGSAEWADPEMEYEYADGPSPGAWKGIGGMAEGFRDFLGPGRTGGSWRTTASNWTVSASS